MACDKTSCDVWTTFVNYRCELSGDHIWPNHKVLYRGMQKLPRHDICLCEIIVLLMVGVVVSYCCKLWFCCFLFFAPPSLCSLPSLFVIFLPLLLSVLPAVAVVTAAAKAAVCILVIYTLVSVRSSFASHIFPINVSQKRGSLMLFVLLIRPTLNHLISPITAPHLSSSRSSIILCQNTKSKWVSFLSCHKYVYNNL